MFVTLPSGQQTFTPLDPRTWIEQAPGIAGTPVTSFDLEQEVASAVAFHRQPLLFQGLGGAQTIPHGTWTPINVSEIWDSSRGHNDADNPSHVRLAQTRSIYDWFLCTGMVPHGASGSGAAGIAGLRVDGGTVYEGAKMALGSGHAMTPMVCDLIQNASGFAYIELMAYQNSGGPLSLGVSTAKAPQLAVRWATVAPADGNQVAWPDVPRTWTPDDVLTAVTTGTNKVPLNTHVRDVLRWLRMPPACRIDTQGSTQTLTSGAWTSINFTAEQLDNYNGHSTGSNPSRYVVQRPGLYYVYGLAAVGEASGATGYRACRLAVNGTTFYAGTSATPAPSTTLGTALAACAHIRLNAGDYVELQMRPQGNNVTVKSGAGDASRLVMLWKGL